MADTLLRFSAESYADAMRVLVEGVLSDGSWHALLTITPAVNVFTRDTLNFDMFTSHAGWQTSEKIPRGIVLKGGDALTKLTTQITQHSYDMLRVETRATLRRSACLESVRDVINLLNFEVDYAWTPQQAPLPEMVIGDAVFRTPAVLVQKGARIVALIPNVKILASQRSIPTALTFDCPDSCISYGCMPYRSSRSSYYAHYDSDTTDRPTVLTYAYYIYYRNSCRKHDGARRLVHRMWRLYAESRLEDVAPQTRPIERCCDVLAANASGSERLTAKPAAVQDELLWAIEEAAAEQEANKAPVYMNDVQSCALQSAYGLALHARRMGKTAQLDLARAAVCKQLGAPRKNGLFPVMYSEDSEPHWRMDSLVGPPGKETLCRLTNLSWAGYWLCRWYKEIEQDENILPLITEYADRLLTLQRHGGHIPAWVRPETGKTVRLCAKSAESSVHALFLHALNEIAPRYEYLRGARRAINFVIRDIADTGRWENTETFYGSSPGWKEKKPFHRDPRQGTYSVHALALWWTAEALIRMYETTSTTRYLTVGQRVLDELALFQQLWDPPYIAVPCFGGFGRTNTDGNWNDTVQSVCAKTFLDYYRACGLTEYFHRGVAALRATYTLLGNGNAEGGVLLPEHCRMVHPTSPKTVYDATESFDAAAGPALCAGELVRAAYGDVYVDTRRRQVFGINGIRVQTFQSDLAGLFVSGTEALGIDRSIIVRTDTGQECVVKIKKNTGFEAQL